MTDARHGHFRKLAQPARLRDQVYDFMRRRLRAGALGPGEGFTEITLADQLGVSRTPVREALIQLVHEGFLAETDHGYMLPEQTRDLIRRRLEMRLVLEPAIARQACADSTPKQQARLKRAVEREADLVGTDEPMKYVTANANLRAALRSMCGNRLLARTSELYGDMNQWYRTLSFQRREHRRVIADYYLNVCGAVMANKPVAAETAMRGAMEYAMDVIEELVPTTSAR